MSGRNIKNIIVALSVSASLLLTGCDEEAIIKEASGSLPILKYSNDGAHHKNIRSDLEKAGVRAANWVYGGSHAIQAHDRYYTSIDRQSMIDYTAWFKVTFQSIIRAGGEAFDCDNVAFLYRHGLSAASVKNKQSKEILCGVVMVKHVHDFGGILSNGSKDDPVLHGLNIVKTDYGWYIVEPQTGKWCPLDSYPNKDYIFRIIF